MIAALRSALREAQRRWHCRLHPSEGLHLLGAGIDAIVMRTPAALQNVDPVDRLLRYTNAAASLPAPRAQRATTEARHHLGRALRSAWAAGKRPPLHTYPAQMARARSVAAGRRYECA